MRGRLLGGETAFVDHRLDHRVVVGDPEQPAVAEHIGARVPDVDERELGAGPHQGRERAAGAVPVRILCRGVSRHEVRHGPGGPFHGVLQQVEHAPGRQRLVVQEREGPHRGRAGGRPVRPAAVGDREDTGARVDAVLVGVTDQTDVGESGTTEFQHAGVLPWGRRQMVHEERRQIPAGGRLGLDLGPVRADLPRGRPRFQGAHPPDPGERHAEPPQPRHQPGLFELRRRVVPVTGFGVHPGGAQQLQLVVEPQRLRRQPGGLREGPDRQHVHPPTPSLPCRAVPRHVTDAGPCPLVKVNTDSAGGGGGC